MGPLSDGSKRIIFHRVAGNSGYDGSKQVTDQLLSRKTLFIDLTCSSQEHGEISCGSGTASGEFTDQSNPLGEEDCFTFNLKFHKISKETMNGTQIPTERQVSKTAMTVYDPIRLLSPITMNMRILLQEIWRLGNGWNGMGNIFKISTLLLRELECAMNIEIARC
ncbi:hypothetical protein JTB14_033308 [Gonioctena quinquepunctata]|nr:hypothetical protein JTB14_033308 [Gonioctena quinquepunctata]